MSSVVIVSSTGAVIERARPPEPAPALDRRRDRGRGCHWTRDRRCLDVVIRSLERGQPFWPDSCGDEALAARHVCRRALRPGRASRRATAARRARSRGRNRTDDPCTNQDSIDRLDSCITPICSKVGKESPSVHARVVRRRQGSSFLRSRRPDRDPLLLPARQHAGLHGRGSGLSAPRCWRSRSSAPTASRRVQSWRLDRVALQVPRQVQKAQLPAAQRRRRRSVLEAYGAWVMTR